MWPTLDETGNIWTTSKTEVLAECPKCSGQGTAFTPVNKDGMKPELTRNREITETEARDLDLLGTMTRKRIEVSFMDIDREWLNENCTGLYCVWDDRNLVGFELDDDYALYRLKFHGAG